MVWIVNGSLLERTASRTVTLNIWLKNCIEAIKKQHLSCQVIALLVFTIVLFWDDMYRNEYKGMEYDKKDCWHRIVCDNDFDLTLFINHERD